jgi:hypothetical protein
VDHRGGAGLAGCRRRRGDTAGAERRPGAPCGLTGACHWLLAASTAIAAAQRHDPPTAADTELLHAIPVNAAPQRQPPQDAETGAELAGQVAVSTARLRVLTYETAHQAAWSPAMTAESWRWTAIGAAVSCHLSQLMLTSLAEQVGLDAGTSEAAAQLRLAAEMSADACARWRAVVTAWSEMTTETKGLTGPGVGDVGDLVVRLGRLAFTDPQWTPARARRTSLRDPAGLAPGPAQFTAVLAAVHHAADALARMGEADRRAVDVAVRSSRIHLPTRALPEYYDVPYRFAYATPAGTAALLDAYQAATQASDLTVTALDAVAVTLNAPSRTLAAARAAVARPVPEADERPAARGRRRRRGRAVRPAQVAPVSRDAAAQLSPGPAEQAVRMLGTSDMMILLRARAIDNAARQLTADAKQGDREPGGRGPSEGNSRPVSAARTAAQVAASSFPVGPVTARTGRRRQPKPVVGDQPAKPARCSEVVRNGRIHDR